MLKRPTIDADPATPGVQTIASSFVRGSLLNNPQVASQTSSADLITVNPVSPTITTNASPSVRVGGEIHDTATLSSGQNPTGTLSFSLFGPDNPTCAGAPVFNSPVQVVGNGSYGSANFTAIQPGAYRWVAGYTGDANNDGANTACNDPAEMVTVRRRVVPADFNGDGRTDLSVFRPNTGQWLAKGILDTTYGLSTDIPVPGDYNGDGTTDVAVWRDPRASGW